MNAALHVGEGYLVHASFTGFRVERGLPAFLPPYAGVSEPDRLRQLFAGALYAAGQHLRRQGTPVSAEPATSLPQYVYRLCGAYQTTHETPLVLSALAEHFERAGRPEVAARCRRVVKEESGHDTLALMDLRALGLPAERLVAEIQPRRALALVEMVRRLAQEDPISVFGYAYALERSALFVGEAELSRMEALLPPGVKASRCFRVHSAVGADVDHVRESLDFMATLPAGEQERIARAVFAAIGVLIDPALDDYPGDEALMSRVATFH